MAVLEATQTDVEATFSLKVLGRTLEHLGVQLYKRRDIAIAELIANCWDAGATRVDIDLPEATTYDQANDCIVIRDNGHGMDRRDVQDAYLVVGRNRRTGGGGNGTRTIMGKKGIGKLAGFGAAQIMEVTTWQSGTETTLLMDLNKLKLAPGEADDLPIPARIRQVADSELPSSSGTKVKLSRLNHKTPLYPDDLRHALGRRFARSVRGQMEIWVNEILVQEPALVDVIYSFPADETGFEVEDMGDGTSVQYQYRFTKAVIPSPEMQGFAVFVRGKTAQAPPYFFGVQGTASGQHSTKYISGEIHADHLDAGDEDESDIISTDRQEIDWDEPSAARIKAWGEKLTRRLLSARADMNADRVEKQVFDDAAFRERIKRLESPLQTKVRSFIRQIGKADAEETKTHELADTLIQAFEYRQFHDKIHEIEAASQNPEDLVALLDHLRSWGTLESRALLEIIKGRIQIIDKFFEMLDSDAPETTSSKSLDNFHDLLAGYPWLLDPDLQIFEEEKRITKYLREKCGIADDANEDRSRFDFLALTDAQEVIVVEIKRPGHAVEREELARLDQYGEELRRAHKEVRTVLVHGGHVNVSEAFIEPWKSGSGGRAIWTWSYVHERVRQRYEQYREVLDSNVEGASFQRRAREVIVARRHQSAGTIHRTPSDRKAGLGEQDNDFGTPPISGSG